MPKIVAESLEAHRDLREHALMSAALDVAREDGWSEVTLAAVSRRAGLSRTAVYSYFDSAADLIADVLLDELMDVTQVLAAALDGGGDPLDRLDAWLTAAVDYVAGGRHALIRSASEVPLPAARRAEVTAWHRRVVGPVVAVLREAGVDEPATMASYLWALVEVAVRRIEGGLPADAEMRTLRAAITRLCAFG